MKNIAIVLNYNDVSRCINLAVKMSKFYCIDKIIIVDNCSNDNSMENLLKIQNEDIIILKTVKNGGYAYGYNYGIRYAIDKLNADNIFICNSDIIIEEELIDYCTEFLKINTEYGIVSTTMLNSNGELEYGYWNFPSYLQLIKECFFFTRNKILIDKKILSKNEVLDIDVVRGSFMCCRASCMELVKGFDENTFLYFEENILGKKMKKIGYKIGVLGGFSYVHNHINRAGFNANGVKISLTSMLYYVYSYCEYNKLQKIILKLFSSIGKIEISFLDKIRKLKNKLKRI